MVEYTENVFIVKPKLDLIELHYSLIRTVQRAYTAYMQCAI